MLAVLICAVCIVCGILGRRESADYCRINGKNLYFLSDDKREELREPLEKLLSNELIPIYGNEFYGDIIGYEAPDPDSPTIVQGYDCGLFDITGDGVPEFFVHPYGYSGSSGAVTYSVYDIITGSLVAELDGSVQGTLCSYYFTETDEIRQVNSYWLRFGWDSRLRYISTIDDSQGADLYLGSDHLLHDSMTDDTDYEYTTVVFNVDGNHATWDEYFYKLEWFDAYCIRIPETEIRMISWSDVSDDEDDRFTRAEKMADALLSSEQQFIVP